MDLIKELKQRLVKRGTLDLIKLETGGYYEGKAVRAAIDCLARKMTLAQAFDDAETLNPLERIAVEVLIASADMGDLIK